MYGNIIYNVSWIKWIVRKFSKVNTSFLYGNDTSYKDSFMFTKNIKEDSYNKSSTNSIKNFND